MAFRRQKAEETQAVKWLEVDASMTGTLSFKDPVNLQINGRFEGTLETKGNLSIGEQANVKATIRGEVITISGSFTGEMTASARVELLETARISGKVISPRVIMRDGAILHGTLQMVGQGGEQAWFTAEELAGFLEVDGATVLQWAKEGRLPAVLENGTYRFERAKVEEWLTHEKIK